MILKISALFIDYITEVNNTLIIGQVENSDNSEISEILQIFFQVFWMQFFDFAYMTKSKTPTWEYLE